MSVAALRALIVLPMGVLTALVAAFAGVAFAGAAAAFTGALWLGAVWPALTMGPLAAISASVMYWRLIILTSGSAAATGAGVAFFGDFFLSVP